MSTDDKPKIIVDDDWKSRVQAEKETLRSGPQEQVQEQAQEKEPPASSTAQGEDRLPPASFETLASFLVTQALASLGQIPLGDKQEPMVNLEYAKHYIDLLGVLETKTKGNLTASEAGMLSKLLSELRMFFVSVQNQVRQQPK